MSRPPSGHFSFSFQCSVVNHTPSSRISLLLVGYNFPSFPPPFPLLCPRSHSGAFLLAPSFCPLSIYPPITTCVQQNNMAHLCASEMDNNALLSICVFVERPKWRGLGYTALNAHWPPFHITNEWPQRDLSMLFSYEKKSLTTTFSTRHPLWRIFFFLFLSTPSSSSSPINTNIKGNKNLQETQLPWRP